MPSRHGIDLTGICQIMSRKQIRSIMECTARINLWSGAVSSGKTIASLLALLFAVVRAPNNGLIFIVGRSLQTVERNIIEVLMQPAGPFGPFARYISHTRGATTASIFGRTVHLIGASDVRAEGRIRGATAALIYVDELTLIPEAFFTMCLSRLRVPGAKLLATTNPDGPSHWVRKNFMLRVDSLDMRQWHFVLDDNPSLTEDYKAAVKTEYTGLFYDRFILGRWCLAEGAVYSSWTPSYHVVTELPPIDAYLGLGIDYGTVNPFAAEVLGLGRDGILYLTNELYYDSKARRRELSDHEYSEQLRDFLAGIEQPHTRQRGVSPQWTIVDPSAASFRIQLYKDGINAVLANNEVMRGIRTVSSLLATGRLRVHASCTGWINEIPGYSWDPTAAEAGFDAPIKAADHALDAGRYAAVTTEAMWRYRITDPVPLPSTVGS
ncbi:PBSX family phage terminase large subunit [Salinispora vitiensis]|uniref:PBSX family phage terminase large subunit n=1 Tax=Salinispora vitiensis TaxID=999544 RepID=UPI00035EC084|nr:PBSX family phage terminase large subunit [Salinispora vitiensis]